LRRSAQLVDFKALGNVVAAQRAVAADDIGQATVLVAGDCGALARNLWLASSGSQAFLSTPSTFSITARAGGILLTALASCTTTGMPANRPCTSVEASKRSARPTSPFLNLMALARSMVCGKSRLNACGGTSGNGWK